MRHLLLTAALFGVGLGVTFGTASVLQDVALAWTKSNQRDGFEVTPIWKPAIKPARQERPSTIDRRRETNPSLGLGLIAF